VNLKDVLNAMCKAAETSKNEFYQKEFDAVVLKMKEAAKVGRHEIREIISPEVKGMLVNEGISISREVSAVPGEEYHTIISW
jgi:hypothetical protein